MKCRTIFKETIFTIGKMRSYFITALLCTFSAAVFAAKPHHITIALSNISEAISWYEEHLDCQAIPGRDCLLYTSPSPRDGLLSRMPSSA